MPNVIALFDDAKRLEAAEAALADTHDENTVVRVFRASQPAASRSDPPRTRDGQAHVVSQQGEVAGTGAPAGSAADFELDAFGEVGDFFWRAHEQGSHLMVLDVEDPERTRRTLQEAGAERVHAL